MNTTPTASQNIANTKFRERLADENVKKYMDGMHIITILFQCARTKKLSKNIIPVKFMLEKLQSWSNEWSERDISTFVYGIRSLECLDPVEGELLKLSAKKIDESKAILTSRAIGNALYGLQDITSSTVGAPELCLALANKIEKFSGDLSGQDIGIGIYGLQGMSADIPEVKKLILAITKKIQNSEADFDAQAMSNALYGLQSMSSDYPEVLELVSALAAKVSESRPTLSAQAIGTALYGLQQLSSDSYQVRALLTALSEKISISTTGLDAQAIGNALFGLQRMKSNSVELRTLVQALANKMTDVDVQMDSKGIGSALYGLGSMSSDVPQVRALLQALSDRIKRSQCTLSGQSIGDALYGLSGMSYDCPELRSLLTALAGRIDSNVGKLDSQDIGNALFGLQGLSSEMVEVRTIASKLAEKIKRSKSVLRSQHIGRALLGLQRLSPDSNEIKFLIKQLTRRIAESDRTRMTGVAIADSVYGLQGMTSNIPEVQELVSELAKKISYTGAELTPPLIGRALFGLQGLSSAPSIFQESAIGIDSDEVQFLLSTLWDKIKVNKGSMSLSSISLGLSGIIYLKDPIANNIRQYLYYQLLQIGDKKNFSNVTTTAKPYDYSNKIYDIMPLPDAEVSDTNTYNAIDVISAVRSLRLNNLKVPQWLGLEYNELEKNHSINPTVQQSRSDKITALRYKELYPNMNMIANGIIDGFRLDMDFPELSLNIELDGPTHRYPSRARYDRARDEYLQVKKGYKIIRINLQGKSKEDIIGNIENIVRERKDEIADKKIQLLYSKDSEIQKLYQDKKK